MPRDFHIRNGEVVYDCSQSINPKTRPRAAFFQRRPFEAGRPTPDLRLAA
jgi:hypothetical protein